MVFGKSTVCLFFPLPQEMSMSGLKKTVLNTHGKKFFVTGGEHVTSNDMFKAAEINRRTAEATEREKDKKGRVDYHRRRDALPILNRLENDLARSLRCYSGGRVSLCQKWGMSRIDSYCTNNLQRGDRKR